MIPRLLSWIHHWRNSHLASPWRKALQGTPMASSAPPSRQGDRILRPKIGVLESQHMWLVRWTAPARSAKFIQNGWTEEIRATKSLPCSSIHIPPSTTCAVPVFCMPWWKEEVAEHCKCGRRESLWRIHFHWKQLEKCWHKILTSDSQLDPHVFLPSPSHQFGRWFFQQLKGSRCWQLLICWILVEALHFLSIPAGIVGIFYIYIYNHV